MKTITIILLAFLATVSPAFAERSPEFCEAQGCPIVDPKYFDPVYWDVYTEVESQYIPVEIPDWTDEEWEQIETIIDTIVASIYLRDVK